MSHDAATDAFIVVNGPEDGAVFPITSARFTFGRSAECLVSPRLDISIAPQHARATAVADGYLIRAAGPDPVYVDGRRAGLVISRTVQHGGSVQLGATLLVCRCAPEGLARRSRGIRPASDLAWALGAALRGVLATTASLARALRRFLRYRAGGLVMPISIILALYLFYPPARAWMHAAAGWAGNLGRWALHALGG